MIPVIVLGSGITALGALRAFGRAGVPVYTYSQPGDMTRSSRFYRGVPGEENLTESNLVSLLAKTTIDKAVLIPCSDQWTLAASELPSSYRERFPASLPTPETLKSFVDKGEFLDNLSASNVPHPYTVLVSSAADIAALPETAFTDLFLKPRDSQNFFARYRRKGFRVKTREEAESRLAELTAAGFQMVIQEYVPGDVNSHYFLDGFIDREGFPRAIFARRRLRIYPLDFGNSTYMESIPAAVLDTPARDLIRLLTAVSYRGVFSAEFKQDSRDGVYRILEINARPWWYVDFAARCGVDVCRMAYDDAQSLPVSTVKEYKVGARCMYPYYDFHSLKEQQKFRLGAWVMELAQSYQPVFCWDDPLPGISAAWELLSRRFIKK